MRTDMADTSLEAYDTLKGSKRMADCYKKILGVMKAKRIYTRRQISRLANMEMSSVAGRVHELIFMREIEVVGRKICPITKKSVEAIQKVWREE
jgi:hypothetical protein